MSIQAPEDIVRVLAILIRASEDVLQDAPIYRKLLLKGAIIDAKNLLAEIEGKPRVYSHEEALKAIRKEMRKVAK